MNLTHKIRPSGSGYELVVSLVPTIPGLAYPTHSYPKNKNFKTRKEALCFYNHNQEIIKDKLLKDLGK